MASGRSKSRRPLEFRRAGHGRYLLPVAAFVLGTLGASVVAFGRPDESRTVWSGFFSSHSPAPIWTSPAPPIGRALSASGDGGAPSDAQEIINRYCVICHNTVASAAELALDSLDATNPGAHPYLWEKVVTRLRTGTMPPAGMPRPDGATYAELTEWLESELDRAWETDPRPGRIATVHRLNRTEYGNSIRDLLGVDLDVRDQLPGDETTEGGFDNVADALTISAAHMERYMSVARQVTRVATGLPPEHPSVMVFRSDDLVRQEDRVSDDLPIGSRGGMAVRHHFPADGEYVISVSLAVNYADYVKGMGWEQDLHLRIDGELADRFTIGGRAIQARHTPDTYAGGGTGTGWPGSPEWEEFMQFGAQRGMQVRIPVTAGPHVVGVSFPRDHWEREDLMQHPPLRLWGQAGKNTHDYMLHAGVSEVRISGPYQVSGTARDTPSRRAIFVCEPREEAEEAACAREILSGVARRAYRRPLTDGDVGRLMGFFHLGREDGRSFDAGIQFGLEWILTSPDFLLRIYRDPPVDTSRAAERTSYPLGDLELASRLSFFLWSSLPDDELLEAAEAGRLAGPAVLRAQVERMTADPRTASSLVANFANQWLMLRILDEVTSHETIYPDFEHNLRDAMRTETELFVASTMAENRSVLDLIGADYTFLNERLARHYGVPGVSGSHFRRVELPNNSQRGGLLAQASILTVSSYPDRTTPVLRGKWLLENILGLEVPSPPEDVDTSLQEEGPRAGTASIRERLARHRDDPRCSACHSLIDPLGFALESFDAIGGWRAFDERGNPVDNVGLWPTGEEVVGFAGIKRMMLEQQSELFVRTVVSKLMAYALGRTVEFYDQPAIREVARKASAEDYTWSSILLGIVESPQFRMRERALPRADQQQSR